MHFWKTQLHSWWLGAHTIVILTLTIVGIHLRFILKKKSTLWSPLVTPSHYNVHTRDRSYFRGLGLLGLNAVIEWNFFPQATPAVQVRNTVNLEVVYKASQSNNRNWLLQKKKWKGLEREKAWSRKNICYLYTGFARYRSKWAWGGRKTEKDKQISMTCKYLLEIDEWEFFLLGSLSFQFLTLPTQQELSQRASQNTNVFHKFWKIVTYRCFVVVKMYGKHSQGKL